MTAARLRLEDSGSTSVPLLRVAGELSLLDTPPLMAAITSALTAPSRVLVCDLSELRAPLTDSLLTAFPAALRRAGGWPRACLHLAGATPDLPAPMRRARLHRYLNLHLTVDDALEAALPEASRSVRQIPLPARPESLRHARAALDDLASATPAAGRTALTRPVTPEDMDAARLVVTELVANSIVHVGQPFTLSLADEHDHLLIAVTDDTRNEPVLRPPRPTAVSGRGMHVVDRLSHTWGVRLTHPRGKTVWAALATSESSSDSSGRVPKRREVTDRQATDW